MSFFAPRSTKQSQQQPQQQQQSKQQLTDQTDKPWIEKYRPKTMGDIEGQKEVVAVLRGAMESANLPHLLFYGPPGTGKTSTILALAQELYGPELMKSRVLELNASDERGISIVREKIKNFAKTTVTQANSTHPCPPYKIIILDEADSMTNDAQSALRRTMETYSKITRFCLICNYVSKIIDPLASRCAKFRFKPLPSQDTTQFLSTVCKSEGIPQVSADAIDMLLKVTEGDLRKAVMYLQSVSKCGEVTRDSIVEIAGVIPPDLVTNFFTTCITGPFEKVEKAINDLVLEGYSGAQFISQMHEYLITSNEMASRTKALVSQRLGLIDKALMDGADEQLQLLNLGSYIMNAVEVS